MSPDEILKKVERDERRAGEAKLRIFLGMSAGVGKTYAMLRAAQECLKDGVDVVVGLVVTHGRVETSALLKGLPILPLKNISHRGTEHQELDLDEILRRKPQLVVIDELAHSNIPGSRHAKRYQDVLEILDAGIDVFTALNIQHLESRKDSVEAITGTSIRETVPDSMIERATLLEVVDIAPSGLLKRLREGKIYIGDKADRAAENFFQEDRLTALREIALRLTAERVDQDLQQFSKKDQGPWQTNERLMVAVSHSPSSEKLIRATRRYAYNLEAPWVAVHVDTGQLLSQADQAQLIKNLGLARELGGEVLTTTETDVPKALRRLSRVKNVTQIVVGRPAKRWLRDKLEGGTLLDRLVRDSLEIDVHVLRQEGLRENLLDWRNWLQRYRTDSGLLKYWYTFCFLGFVSLISGFLEPLLGYQTVGFLFLLAVLIVGLFGSIGAVGFSALMSALIWNFFFIPPRMTFAIGSADDVALCLFFFLVAIITGFLTNRIRFDERLMREREERTHFLYEVLKEIAYSREQKNFLEKVAHRVSSFFQAEVEVLLRNEFGKLDFPNLWSEKDRAVADWSYQNRKKAGWSTETLSENRALYLPIQGQSEISGLLIFRPLRKSNKLTLDQENLLQSIVSQLGISVERHSLAQKIEQTRRLKDSEKLHQTLLNSISHEIRTPLTALLGTANSLELPGNAENPLFVKSATQSLVEAGDRLNQVVENLLDMSRLTSEALALKLEWHDLNDLLGVVLKKNEKALRRHKVKSQGLEEVALANIDFRLMEHALSNILLNAGIYSPTGTEIGVRLLDEKDGFAISVEDQGPGIPESSRELIFEKFFRLPGTAAGGTGLGLSIAKSIIDLHQGKIAYFPGENGGSLFRIQLPKDLPPSMPIKEEP